jgi:GTP cyclohydrolase I
MSFNRDAVQQAIQALLEGAGVAGEPDVGETPRLVAEAWEKDLLDGYGQDPVRLLADRYPSDDSGLVVLSPIAFHSMCPHHLLPYSGEIHLGYVPNGEVVGLSRLVRLVDALAHRLILQEHLGTQLADALTRHLGAQGAGVIVQAHQGCIHLRGPRRNPQVTTHAWSGVLGEDTILRREFLQATKQAGIQ